MNFVEVKILRTTVTHAYGTLAAGSVLRTSPEFAAHLVDDCGAAEYSQSRATGDGTAGAGEATVGESAVAAEAKSKPRARKGSAAMPDGQAKEDPASAVPGAVEQAAAIDPAPGGDESAAADEASPQPGNVSA